MEEIEEWQVLARVWSKQKTHILLEGFLVSLENFLTVTVKTDVCIACDPVLLLLCTYSYEMCKFLVKGSLTKKIIY